jgi:hypothetical protein
VRGKVWWGGEDAVEPEAWAVAAIDHQSAVLQRPGGIGMTSYLSKEAITSDATVSFFDVVAKENTA